MSDFPIPTLTDLTNQSRSDLNGRIPGADSYLRRSLVNALAVVWAGMVYMLYIFLGQTLANEILPDTAIITLDRQAAIWGETRKAASFAGLSIQVTGSASLTVPAGTQLQRSDDFLYTVDADVTLTGATGTVAVTAVTSGSAGNAIADTTLSFVSPISGISSSATVLSTTSIGGDSETDDQLRARILQRISSTPQGGSQSDYERWVLSVPGVTRAWIFQWWTGPGKVGVTFVCDGRDNIIPTGDDIAAVQAYLATVRPVGGEPVVFASTPDAFNLTIAISPNTTAVQAAIQAEIIDLLAREAAPGGTELLSHIAQAIGDAAGDEDYRLDFPTANVTHAPGHLAVFGAITWESL